MLLSVIPIVIWLQKYEKLWIIPSVSQKKEAVTQTASFSYRLYLEVLEVHLVQFVGEILGLVMIGSMELAVF